jgi:hypothetical protein
MSDHLADHLARVDDSLAKQLQASMERNARMKSELRALQDNPSTPSGTAKAIAQILKDGA